ncbi:MAG: DotA/TraY family protein [Alphaproteobacteria bacterium]|nr:DotA/TraY family protein [Alphaproteobacteria bacterium]
MHAVFGFRMTITKVRVMGSQGWQRDDENRQNAATNDSGHEHAHKKPGVKQTLNFLFNPEFGKSVTPLKGAGNMFTHMLALVFSQHGLFPRNHPGLAIDARLSLSEVIGTAWQSLRWSKDNVPQIFLFFSITGFLVFATLTLIFMLLGMLTGTAHAAEGDGGGGFFEFASDDISKQMIDYLFFAQGSSAFPANPALQTAVRSMFGFYSSAMLVFAAFILLYILVSMVAETAHHGVVMGKRASQIWAPVRLVIAVGMLVPLGGTLSSGQLIVLQVASWGAGLGSQVWNIAIEGLRSMQFQIRGPDQIRGYGALVRGMVENYACWHAYDVALEAGAAGGGLDASFFETSAITEQPTLNGNGMMFGNRQARGFQMCGGYELPATPAGAGSENAGGNAVRAFIDSSRSTFTESLGLQGDFGTLAEKIVKAYHPDIPADERGEVPGNGQDGENEFMDLVVSYQQKVNQATTQAFQAQQADIMSTLLDEASAKGWAGAGRFLYDLSVTQNTILDVSSQALPKAIKASLMYTPSDGWVESSARGFAHWWERLTGDDAADSRADSRDAIFRQVTTINGDVQQWLTAASTLGPTRTAGEILANAGQGVSDFVTGSIDYLNEHGSQVVDGILNEMGDMVGDFGGYVTSKGIATGFWAFDTILWIAEKAFSYAGVWDGNGNLGLSIEQGNTNPFMELIALGQKWIHANMGIAGLGIMCNLIPYCPNGGGMLLIWAGLIGMTPGIFIAFMLPLLPFIKFFFLVITWIIGVFEAVLMIPIMAIAHLSPEGEGLPGKYAEHSYFLILNVFLRPVLMVFGLVAGLLIFGVSISLLNSLFLGATTGTGSGAIGSTTLSKIMFTVIYMTLAYTAANSAFKCIDFFPSQALLWVSKSAVTQRTGDPGVMEKVVSGAGALALVGLAKGTPAIGGGGAAAAGGGGGDSGGGRSAGSLREGEDRGPRTRDAIAKGDGDPNTESTKT